MSVIINKHVISTLSEEVTEFLAMENSIKKNILYHNNFRGNHLNPVRDITIFDDKICYSSRYMVIKKGSYGFYLKKHKQYGFTYDKKTKKINFWFRTTINDYMYMLETLFNMLNIDWVNKSPSNIKSYITKTILEKIISGAITNPRDLLKAYLKSVRFDCSHNLLYNTIRDYGLNKNSFYAFASISKNIDHYLQWYSNVIEEKQKFGSSEMVIPHIDDISEQCSMLGEKVDFRWSVKRFMETHRKFTREIMKHKRDSLSTTVIPSMIEKSTVMLDTVNISNNNLTVSLLDTELKVFDEGYFMEHCVYTNYYRRIKEGTYLCYNLTYKNKERGTLGLRLFYDNDTQTTKLIFDQLQGKRNSPVSKEMFETVKSYLIEQHVDFNKDEFYNNNNPLYLQENVHEVELDLF